MVCSVSGLIGPYDMIAGIISWIFIPFVVKRGNIYLNPYSISIKSF